MPAFKAKYLADAIQSVLNQTYRDFELIIVNDKSPEDLTSIVKSFNDPRIRYYINDVNLGSKDIVANWNKCLSYAKGEFFCLICDDDLYEPTFLEEMVLLANRFPKCNVFRSGVQIIDRDGKAFDFYPSSPEWESCEDYMWHVFRGYRCQTITEWFYRRNPIVKIGGYVSLPLAWYSDFLSIFTFAKGNGIASTSKRLVSFRMSGDNITSQEGKNARKKMEASYLFEVKVKKLISSMDAQCQVLLTPLLRKYLDTKRTYSMSRCCYGDFLKFLCERSKLNISSKIIVKSLMLRIKS